jgi:hypothetical protein
MTLDLVPIWTLILGVAVFMARWNKGATPPCISPKSDCFGRCP